MPAIATPPMVAAECVKNDRRSNVDDILILLSPWIIHLVWNLLWGKHSKKLAYCKNYLITSCLQSPDTETTAETTASQDPDAREETAGS